MITYRKNILFLYLELVKDLVKEVVPTMTFDFTPDQVPKKNQIEWRFCEMKKHHLQYTLMIRQRLLLRAYLKNEKFFKSFKTDYQVRK